MIQSPQLSRHARWAYLKVIVLCVIALPFLANCRKPATTTTHNQAQSVTNLIEQLASKRPPPYTNILDDEIPRDIEIQAYRRFCTPEVENAILKLRELGPSIFPELVKHLGDKRYSYSQVVAEWGNYPVSEAVIEVLSDGHDMHSGYKWRESPNGEGWHLSFGEYLRDREPDKWALWASNKTKLEIQEDFIRWCVLKEEERGFTDDQQRERIKNTYQNARARMIKEYSK